MIKEEELGQRLRAFRRHAGLTLRQLASMVGISQGYLSKIENSSNAPPVSTLLMLVRALGISISELFGETESRNPITRVKKDEREFVARDGSVFGYSYQALAHKFYPRHMDPYILTIPGGRKKTRGPHFQHKGEELLFVLKGHMKFIYGDQKFTLEQGDCVFFDAGVPHDGYSLDENDVECLIVIYTPE